MKEPTNSLINFGYGLTLPDFISNLGAEGNGLIGETITIPDPAPTPQAAAWVKKFRELYDAAPAAGSFAVYTGVKMWAAAVKAVGSVSHVFVDIFCLNVVNEAIRIRH